MNNFIYETFLEDISLCDRLIDFYKMSDKKTKGISGNSLVQEHLKKSTDVGLTANDNIAIEYVLQLNKAIEAYSKLYEHSLKEHIINITEGMNIQHYAPTEGFYRWHHEKAFIEQANGELGQQITRHLVFMTYLNDVKDGGGTEFLYQGVKTTAVKGKTLIFPAEWTHTHRGVISNTEDKYIITGWLNLVAEASPTISFTEVK
jgi:hypothetical protein